jgi:O-antigen/teichoic acid export membrane protein
MTGNAEAPGERGGVVRVARDAVLLSGSSVAAAVLSFLAWVYLARVLLPEEYGALAAAFAFVALFQMFGDFGVNYYAIREGSKDAAHATQIWRTLFGLKLSLLGGATAVVLLLAFVFPFRPTERALILVYLAALPIGGVATYLSGLLNAHRRMTRLASVQLAERVAYVGLVPPLVALGMGAPGAVLAAVGSASLYAILVWAAIARVRTGPLWPPDRVASWRPHLAAAFAFGVAALLMNIVQRVDVVLLAVLSDPRSLAGYVAAVQVFFLLLLMATGLAQAAFPWIVRRMHRGEMPLRALGKWTAALGLLSTVIAIAASAGAPVVFPTLFGPDLAQGAAAFRILVWAIVPAFTTIPLSLAIDALNLQKVHVLNASAMVTINVGLNLTWIPSMGASGAAWAAVVSWGYALLVGAPIAFLMIRRRQRKSRRDALGETTSP